MENHEFPGFPTSRHLRSGSQGCQQLCGRISSITSRTCGELQRIVQALSTTPCFVSNFEISTFGEGSITVRRRRPGRCCAAPTARDPFERRAAGGDRLSIAQPAPQVARPFSARGAGAAWGVGNKRDPGFRQNRWFLGNFEEKWRSRPISRVLSWTVIPLGAASPLRSSSLPGPDAGHVMRSLFGLAPGGVCRAGLLPGSRCALTAPFHPCHASEDRSAVSFCCTFRRLAPPRRYLAPCPVEPGLSSAFHEDME